MIDAFGGGEGSFGAKPRVLVEPEQAPLPPPRICNCTLTGEIHVFREGEGCEVCDCSEDFTMENVNAGFKWCFEQLNSHMETINNLNQENARLVRSLKQKVSK